MSTPPTSSPTRTSLEQDEAAHLLTGNVLDALRINPPLYAISLLGKPQTWVRRRRYSEFSVLSPWRPWRTLRTVINVTVPSLPLTPPSLGSPLINKVFWQPSVILQRPDHHGSYTTFPEEHWFFLNGIMTNDEVAQLNAAYLAYLFHRPITLIQNSTDSVMVDLLECAVGKQWQRTTEPLLKAFPAIYDALKSPHKRRVVVIAHSQGTIVMANVLRLLKEITHVPPLEDQLAELVAPPQQPRYAEPEFVFPDETPLVLDDFEPLTAEELAKLELYCFATCASQLRYIRPATTDDPPLPWIEHFGNQQDIVARLGMLAPRPTHWGVHIDGPCYVNPGAWGHLLNEHHLFAIEHMQKRGRRRGAAGGSAPFTLRNREELTPRAFAQTPRLFRYINGGA